MSVWYHLFMSSKHCNNVLVSFPLPPRFLSVKSAWNSSRKITDGAFFPANSKLEAIIFSLVPTSALTISLTLKDINVPPSSPEDGSSNILATAFANIVFPHPGGPYNSTPVGGERPNLDSIPLFTGSKASASSKEILACSFPPIDAKCNVDLSLCSFKEVLGAKFVTFVFTRAIASSKSCKVAIRIALSPHFELIIRICFNWLATLRNTLPFAHAAEATIDDSLVSADASSIIPSLVNAP
mmetsp:Transcript_17018/g.19068  ORF Transcript_17018/g.19068 Transcript_17018/m.19068 type:complete len:240 (-) Transcript_17018:1253-1972(-)